LVQIRSGKNILAGILFAGCGALGLILGQDYAVGSAFRMGPGYFPTIVGWALVLIGLVIAGMGFAVDGEEVPRIAIRPLILVLASVVLFGLLLRPFGLIISIVVLTVVARLGGWDMKPLEIAILALVLTAGSVLVFVYGLGLPFSAWPR
jgi:hypothetical protein